MKMRKILALIIALAMCISVFPARIFAVNYNGVEFTALDGTGENGEGENYEKLLDGKKTSSNPSKWCDKIGLINGIEYIPYIIFKASQKIIITDYNFITGNDNKSWLGRNPKDWVLYGCNDYDEENKTGGTWDAIHTVTDNTVMQNVNFTSYNFKIDDNDKMYQYYKLVILKNQLVNGTTRDTMQLGEMEINWTVANYVTFDKNGGETEASPQTIKWGKGFPTTLPTKTDHRFLGWYTKDGTDGDWGEEFTADTTVSEDTTIYAKWEKLYWVTFDLNGGTANSPINSIYHGEPLPTEIPTKENFKFGGWFTKDGTNDDWGEQYTPDTVVTENITVYAKWNTVNITFDKNGGDTEANPSIISSGEQLPTVNPTRNGYKFLGWYTTNGKDDLGESFTQEMSNAAMADMTVYARWEIATITFDSNNGEVEEKPNQLFYGETPETDPTMAGFTFDGWYTKNGMSTGDWGEKYLEGAVINNDTRVYAKWKATDKDCLANVTLTALSGTAGANSGESYDKLVDGKKIAGNFSKWCVTSFKGAEVILRASAYTIPVGYTLTTGNDNTDWNGRNPKDWVLYASNDYDENEKTVTWTEIDNVTNDTTLEDKDFKSYNFTISNTKAYKYFKLEISSVKSGDVMQLGEFELIGEGCEHTFGEPEIIEPTCTIPGKTEYRCLQCDVPVVINDTEVLGHILGENGTCSVCGEVCGAQFGDMYYFDLQEAIDAARTSGSDEPVTLLNNVDITDTLTIGSGKVTLDLNGHTINMTGSGSVIKLTDSNSNFILDDGSAEKTGIITNSSTDTEYGGGIYIYDGKMTMNGGTIKACIAKYGGGIYKRSGELKIVGGTITECKADGDFRSRGGGIFNYNGKLEIAGGTISKCSADGWYSGDTQYAGGGGIFNFYGNLVMSCGTITECTASGGIHSTGGGIKSYSSSAVVEMNGGTISNCSANKGGGIYACESHVIIKGGTISNCSAKNGGGGGIYITAYAAADIGGGIISGNSASENGGGINNFGVLNITNCEIENNTASKNGGGLYTELSSSTNKGIVTMSGGTISGNKASKEGGGIYIDNGGNLTMTGGTVESNTASQYDGGGIMFYNNSTGTISNALIKGNKASNFGGGIQVENSSNVTIENTEITENTTYGGGGVSAQNNSTVTITGGKIFKNNSKQGCGLRIDVAVAHLNGGAEISENGSADGMYNDLEIYGAGIWTSESTINFNDASVINNHGYKGGGVYTYDDVVYLNLSNGNITGNTAIAEAGGICCKTNEITIKGGIQITGNKLISETEEIENNVYLRNNTTLQVINPCSEIESDDGLTKKEAQIGVTVEGESSNIVAAYETDYSKYFKADLPEERVYYDTSDNIVKLGGTYTIVFDYGDGKYYGTAERGKAVAETEKIPTREGFYFGGWFIGDTPYDFTKPVFGNMTLTAKWLKAGEFGISITPSKIYIAADNAKAYGAAYKGGVLTDIIMQDIVDYEVIELSNIGLNWTNADTISLFVWDENQAPLCDKISFNFGG